MLMHLLVLTKSKLDLNLERETRFANWPTLGRGPTRGRAFHAH